MGNNTDALITAANALINEHVAKNTLQRALRDGITVRSSGFFGRTIEMISGPDRALVDQSRVVICRGVVSLEMFNGRDWQQVWCSDAAPEATPSNDAPAVEATPEQPPPQYRQLVWTQDGFKVWGTRI
jgi:hypothetical protein